jgi:alkaline phosphatase
MVVKMKKKKASADEMKQAVLKAIGITNLSADEAARLDSACKQFIAGKSTKGDKLAASMGYGKYNPLIIEAMRIRDNRNGFVYTSFSHTPVKVTTFVKGAGAENFKVPQENSDIPHRIAAAAGLPGMLEKESNIPPFPIRKKKTLTTSTY